MKISAVWKHFIVSMRDNVEKRTILKFYRKCYFYCVLLCFYCLMHFTTQLPPARLGITSLHGWQVWNRSMTLLLCADLTNQSVIALEGYSLSLVISQPSAPLFPKWPRTYLFRYGGLNWGDPWCRSMPAKSQQHMSITTEVRFLCGINFFPLFSITRLYFFLEKVITIFFSRQRKKCWIVPWGTREWCQMCSLDHFSIAGIMPFQLTRQ